jgi:hypothetical protein
LPPMIWIYAPVLLARAAFIASIQNITALADERGERLFGVCPPPDSTLLDFVRIFVQHARTEDVEAQTLRLSFCPGWPRRFLVEVVMVD